MSLTTRQESPVADADGLIAFLQAYVNPRMTRRAYMWQFVEIPFTPVLMVVREDGAIVSTQSFLPHVLMRGRQVLDTLKSEHSFLSSAFRGTPVFTDAYAAGLKSCAEQGRTVCWGYTPAVKVWRDRLGFQVFPGLMSERVTIFAPSRSFEDLSLHGIARALREHLRYWRFRLLRSDPHGEPSWDHETITPPVDGSVEGLYARTCGEFFRLRMDHRFLEWRIHSNPNLNFSCRYFFKQDTLVACYMFAIHQEHPELAHLSEFMYHDHGDGAVLMDRLRKDVLQAGARRVQYFGNARCPLNQRVFALLDDAGPSHQWMNDGMAFVLKDPGGLTDPEPSKWYMTALWTQGFTR